MNNVHSWSAYVSKTIDLDQQPFVNIQIFKLSYIGFCVLKTKFDKSQFLPTFSSLFSLLKFIFLSKLRHIYTAASK